MGKGATINERGYGARPYAPPLTHSKPREQVRSLEDIVHEAHQSLRPKKPSPSISTQRRDTPRKRVEALRPRRERCEYGVGLEPEGMFHGLEVQQVLDGGKRFLVWGWPTPIQAGARTELPPAPWKPTYGPAARKEARALMAEAKREKINLGWSTKRNLCKVANGECPLSYSVWRSVCDYIQHVRWEREQAWDLRERPMQFQLIPGQGVQIEWR